MKNKIFAKLFHFADSKFWKKESSNKIVSSFYKEYKLEFLNEGLGWYYRLYRGIGTSYSGNNEYSNHADHKGFITLNKGGKITVSSILFFLFLIIEIWVFDISLDFTLKSLPKYLITASASLFASYFIFSIFNWKIYKSLRKAIYNINNSEIIKQQEEEIELDKKIVTIINKKVTENPKLARKTKLKELNKRKFPWSK